MMKKICLLLSGVFAAILLYGCGDFDDTNDRITTDTEGEKPEDEKSAVVFQFEAGKVGTYASTDDDYDFEQLNNEEKINTDLELYIFYENGKFYDHWKLPLSKVSNTLYRTDERELVNGSWYMYAFVNTSSITIPEPDDTMDMFAFETTQVDLSSVLSHYSLMGTLAREKVTVNGTGTSGNPETIKLAIGHLMAKFSVDPQLPLAVNGLNGTFAHRKSVTTFSVHNIPRRTYLVAQTDGPFRSQGTQVFSPYYYSYVRETDFTMPLYPTPTTGTDFYYTAENTNEVPRQDNATFLCVEYQYKPDPDEIYDSSFQPGATLSSNVFYLGYFDDEHYLICNADPEDWVHPVFGPVIKSVPYLYGICYYRFPFTDLSEAMASKKYAVLRNHHYKIKVNSISFIGEPYPGTEWDVDPTDPLDKDNKINFTVDIVDWVPYYIDVELE